MFLIYVNDWILINRKMFAKFIAEFEIVQTEYNVLDEGNINDHLGAKLAKEKFKLRPPQMIRNTLKDFLMCVLFTKRFCIIFNNHPQG